MTILPNIGDYLNSSIDRNSENVLLIFPNSRLKAIYKMYCFPRKNEILITSKNITLLKKIDGIRFRKYKFIGYDEVLRIRDELYGRFERRVLMGTSKENPIGLSNELKRYGHKQDGYHITQIIYDEYHNYKDDK